MADNPFTPWSKIRMFAQLNFRFFKDAYRGRKPLEVFIEQLMSITWVAIAETRTQFMVSIFRNKKGLSSYMRTEHKIKQN
jgi:hypothetical protein